MSSLCIPAAGVHTSARIPAAGVHTSARISAAGVHTTAKAAHVPACVLSSRRTFLDRVLYTDEYSWFNMYISDAEKMDIYNSTCYDPLLSDLISSDSGNTVFVWRQYRCTRKDLFEIVNVILDYVPDIISIENKLLPIKSIGFIVFYIIEYMLTQGTYIKLVQGSVLSFIKSQLDSPASLLTIAKFPTHTGTYSHKTPMRTHTKKGLHVRFSQLPEKHNSSVFKEKNSYTLPKRAHTVRPVIYFKSEQFFMDSWSRVVAKYLKTDISHYTDSTPDPHVYDKIRITMTYTRIAYIKNWKNPSISVPIIN